MLPQPAKAIRSVVQGADSPSNESPFKMGGELGETVSCWSMRRGSALFLSSYTSVSGPSVVVKRR